MNDEKKIEVSYNNLQGVVWDGQAIDSINNISKALLNLTELFKSQNITIESMIKVDNGDYDVKLGEK